jgi:hypothetical protein
MKMPVVDHAYELILCKFSMLLLWQGTLSKNVNGVECVGSSLSCPFFALVEPYSIAHHDSVHSWALSNQISGLVTSVSSYSTNFNAAMVASP